MSGPAPDLILASASPRRRRLLREAGLRFRVRAPDIDETPRAGEAPAAFARRAAAEKADAVAARLGPPRRPRIVIGCDTVVALGPRIFGKPRDAAEATAMLRTLAGRTHAVITGLCALEEAPGRRPRRRRCAVRTAVQFRALAPGEIARYAASPEPYDKAGGYAIQGAAAGMVRWVRGSVTNVIGLPVAELLALLDGTDRQHDGLGTR